MSTQTNILIVEDSQNDADLVALLLARTIPSPHFQMVESEVGLRDAVAAKKWDLVICDHVMPGFDSKRALAVLQNLNCDAPCVIYSGEYTEAQGIEAMRLGARDFVEKNSPGRLAAVAQRELGHILLKREKEIAELRAEEVSRYDALTRLPNGLFLKELCDQALYSLKDLGKRLVLIYADVDRFMRINESYGYATGDALLQAFATRLKSIAGGAIVSRVGTDEFVILAESLTTQRSIQHYLERMLSRISEPFFVNGQDFYLSASLGICIAPDHAVDTTTLLKNAESAMQYAKRDGGAQFAIYSDAINQGASRKVRLEQGLRHAIELNQLSIAYQPILDLNTGTITGHEALLRWRHPDFGYVSPVEFINIAEESNQVIALGEWVLKTACRQTKAWQDMGYRDLSISVNFTATQFRQENLIQRLMPMIVSTGLPPQSLQVEITETIAMRDAEATIATLQALARAGIKLSIDDFGTGYSSLAYLKRFPLDVLKIDKAFVRDVHLDMENQAIVRAIIALGKALKLLVLAEGVECQQEMDFLISEGCDRMQGYHFAKPSMELPQIEALLAKHGRRFRHHNPTPSAP